MSCTSGSRATRTRCSRSRVAESTTASAPWALPCRSMDGKLIPRGDIAAALGAAAGCALRSPNRCRVSGIGADSVYWRGQNPSHIVNPLNRVGRILTGGRAGAGEHGAVPDPASPEQFDKWGTRGGRVFRQVVRDIGMRKP